VKVFGGSSQTRQATLEFVFAIQLAGEVREILVVKATAKHEFFAFPVYSRVPALLKNVTGRNAVPAIDVHASKHSSGERHLRVKLGGKRLAIPQNVAWLQSPTLRGVELLVHMPLFKYQFRDLPVVGTNKGKSILLDADSTRFRDDFIAIRAYLVEPGKDREIPTPEDVAHSIRHIEKSTTPWVAVELYQERGPFEGSARGARER
jgi:hypothetical protein